MNENKDGLANQGTSRCPFGNLTFEGQGLYGTDTR